MDQHRKLPLYHLPHSSAQTLTINLVRPCFVQTIVKNGYMSGGGGYAISREALKRFGERGYEKLCDGKSGTEDVEVGKCMQTLGKYIIKGCGEVGANTRSYVLIR